MKKFALFVVGLLLVGCAGRPDVGARNKVVELHITMKPDAVDMKTADAIHIEQFAGKALCSGAFISDRGDIITARHCTENAAEIEVVLSDGKEYTARVVSQSDLHDLAVIHIDRKGTPFFAKARTPKAGDPVYILGSPLGLTDTLTMGTVAKVAGDLTLLDCTALPGNSGGPVFNKAGEMVGVLTAGYIVMMGTTHLTIAQGVDAVTTFAHEVILRRR